MARQFAPRLPEQRAGVQSRQGFPGSRSGGSRNAAPLTSRGGKPSSAAVAGALFAATTTQTGTASDVTLTLGAAPVAGSLLIWVDGLLLDPATAYTVTGAVVTLTSALTGGENLVDQYWTTTVAPGASVLS